MNKVELMGRLTKDPVIRYSANEEGSAVARYTLAVDRRYRKDNKADADFISCVAFGKGAEFVSKYLRKGTKVVVCGRIQTGHYVDSEGRPVYTTDVVAEEHYFAENRSSERKEEGTSGRRPQNQETQTEFTELLDDEEELPF